MRRSKAKTQEMSAEYALELRTYRTATGPLVIADLLRHGTVIVPTAIAAKQKPNAFTLYTADAAYAAVGDAVHTAHYYFHAHLYSVYGQTALNIYHSVYSAESAIAAPMIRTDAVAVKTVQMHLFEPFECA